MKTGGTRVTAEETDVFMKRVRREVHENGSEKSTESTEKQRFSEALELIKSSAAVEGISWNQEYTRNKTDHVQMASTVKLMLSQCAFSS